MRLLHHLLLSPHSRKVRLALAEKRIPFETVMEKVWDRREAFLAMNPAGTVPVLVEENGLVVADSSVICEYLDEAYPDPPLMGRTLAERCEVRRLCAWFDQKFAVEVTANLVAERTLKRLMGRGHPEASALRAGYQNLRGHLDYLGWLAEMRPWLAGRELSMADLAAAAHLSTLDYIGDVDWAAYDGVKHWYARMKSRPSFRAILADRVPDLPPAPHYADLDF